MQCPQCQSDLVPQKIDGITTDVCPACVGIWFDPGEFGAYGRNAGAPLAAALEAFVADADTTSPCPRCRSDAVVPGHAGSHRLLRCGACTGVFLRAKGAEAAGSVRPGGRPSAELVGRLAALLHSLLDARDDATG